MTQPLKWTKHNHAWFMNWTAEVLHSSGFTLISFEIEKCINTYRLTINGSYEGDFLTLNQAKLFSNQEHERIMK